MSKNIETSPGLPADYAARVYAGVLGKIIGVYLGRPFEQWPYERIAETFGDVDYYVNEQAGVPLIVADDDITGTFTFIRALEDHGTTADLTAEQIGQTWLNYIIENRSILWWGGLGYAAEHTAFLRLKAGIPAPRSGSLELNGWQIAEEIGSQIFIEGWAFVAPGNPALAAALAREAASVSHDREGIYGAQVIAVLAAQAFVESDLDALLDLAVSYIPADSEIARCIADVRAWHRAAPADWRATRLRIVERYGYARYGTNCPIVSNHSLVILGLLYGEDNFSKSLQITCNAAYDTDCNAANVGAILGIKNGLAGIDRARSGRDWRGPVADRLLLPTAEGGSCFSDALTVSTRLVGLGRALAGLEPELPKHGVRYHFSQPGSVQGFMPADGSRDALAVGNAAHADGARVLELRVTAPGGPWDAVTDTFIVSKDGGGYGSGGAPSVYPGQTLRAQVEASSSNARALQVALVLFVYGQGDALVAHAAPPTTLAAGETATLEWRVPEFDGRPIARVGLRLTGAAAGDVVWVDHYTWTGEPAVSFHAPAEALAAPRDASTVWMQAWVNAVDTQVRWEQEYRTIIQNRGRGLVSTGTLDWRDYHVRATLKMRAAQSGGLAVRYGGLERYYGLMLRGRDRLTLFKRCDGVETILVEVPFEWEYETLYELFVIVEGARLRAGVGEHEKIGENLTGNLLPAGGIALLVEEGCLMARHVTITPAKP